MLRLRHSAAVIAAAALGLTGGVVALGATGALGHPQSQAPTTTLQLAGQSRDMVSPEATEPGDTPGATEPAESPEATETPEADHSPMATPGEGPGETNADEHAGQNGDGDEHAAAGSEVGENESSTATPEPRDTPEASSDGDSGGGSHDGSGGGSDRGSGGGDD